jgi:hypothetical protein
MSNTGILTTPLELYFAYKESPTEYWAVRIQANQYLGTDDSNPLNLEPNICGPIVDSQNVSFVEKIEPDIETVDRLSFIVPYDAIMVVDEYHKVPAFHKASVDFNQRIRLGEILVETLDAPGNEPLKEFFVYRQVPSLFIKESTVPLQFFRFRREITYQVVYNFLRNKVKTIQNLTPPSSYIYPEGNRYETCGGTVKFGKTLEIRKYTFDFALKDFSGYANASSLDAATGISKILEGKKIASAPTIPGPYRVKVFFKPEDKQSVKTSVEGILGSFYYPEIIGTEELVYRILASVPDFRMTNLINFLKTSDKVEDWGISGPDTIFKFGNNTNFIVISERALVALDPSEDIIEQLLDIVLEPDEITAVQAEYQAFLADERNVLVEDTPELEQKWLDAALTRKRQKLYFIRKAFELPPPPIVEGTPNVTSPSNATFSDAAPQFERYNATGEIPLTVYGSWERALDEAKQTILKEFETIQLPDGSSTVEYKDFLIGTYRKYHSNGFLWRIETYKNETKAMKSLLDGPYLEYFEDGRRRILGGFQDDLLHGAYREFYRNTIPKCQGTLRRGKLNGLYVQWDDEGNRLFKAYFIGGALNNSYVLDYQVFASTPCLSRNGIYMELERLFEIQETYTFTELYDALIAKDLLDVDNQPEYQLLEILKEVAVRISGGEDHGKYKLKENIILV